jgi:hypothetical protein
MMSGIMAGFPARWASLIVSVKTRPTFVARAIPAAFISWRFPMNEFGFFGSFQRTISVKKMRNGRSNI